MHTDTEAEEEEIEKPVYTDEQLEKLIGFFKKMTTLYDLKESDWTEDNCLVIRNFIIEPSEMVLTVYFDDDNLQCLLDFPDTPFIDLTYFIREANDIFKIETFHDKITFGTVNSSVEGSLLSVLENVYAPFFFNNTTWPDSILFS